MAPSGAPPAASAVEKAKFAVALALTSLPSAIKTLAYKFNAKFLELRIQLRTLESTKSRLLQEDFYPHSARIKFELNATRRVKEQAGAEYQALAEQASYALAIFKNTVKQKVARVVDLEIKVCKDEIANEFCKGVFALAGAFAINHPVIDSVHTNDLINLVFENHHPMLLEYAELSDGQSFFNRFRIATELPDEAHVHGSLPLERKYPVEAAEESFTNLLEAVFVRSWNAYLGIKAEQQRQLDLQEYLETSLKNAATAPVAMQLDNLTLDSIELKDFVASTIADQTKSLQSQISKLTNQLNAKNQTSGATKSSARPEKKKDQNQTTRQQKSKAANAQKAATAANGSTDAKKKNGKQKQKQKPRRRGTKNNKQTSA
jgi:hypothetical protein